ncbi:hypothetical protein LINPERPRIM_LOCUS10046 [Linum perenne]
MTELAANNGVVDGIFKGGAYKELERMMEVRANGCGVKNHPNCNGLNGKPFPQYENLLKVFGRSRATGKGAVAATEITQIRPAIEKAVDSMVNNLIGNDEESNNKRLRIMTDLQNLPGLTRHQVIDAASALYRDENHRDLEFFYMLDTMEDKLYFILAMLRK